MYKLEIRDDEGRTTLVPLLRDEVTIGREEGSAIRLTERNVSRKHATLRRQEDEFQLVDTSRYGTRVNGARIRGETQLIEQDVIRIGDYELRLEQQDAVTPAVGPDSDTLQGVPPEEGATWQEDAITSVGEVAIVDGSRSAERPRLVIVSSHLAGTTLTLGSDAMKVGRTRDNDLIIDHRSISRHHAQITWRGGEATVTDLASANGIKVNGEACDEAILRRGDFLQLGHVRLRYIAPGETFVFETAHGAENTLGSYGGRGLWLFVCLAVVAGALTAAWFLYYSQEALPDPVSSLEQRVRPPSGGDGPGAAGKQTKQPRRAAARRQGGARDGAVRLSEASGHLNAERWDKAIRGFSAALALDPGMAAAKSGLRTANNEKVASEAYGALRDLVKRAELELAYRQVVRLDAVTEGSVYYGRATELKKAIVGGYVTQLLDRGETALRKRHHEDAIALADEALEISPGNVAARSLRVRARKRERAGEAPAADRGRKDAARSEAPPEDDVKEEPAAKEQPAPSEAAPAPPGTAKELYKAGRKLHNSNSAEALKLYKQAASKGYARAHRQMGSIHLRQGDTSRAIRAYKKYLNLSPGASDAVVIRDTIIRLGGSP